MDASAFNQAMESICSARQFLEELRDELKERRRLIDDVVGELDEMISNLESTEEVEIAWDDL